MVGIGGTIESAAANFAFALANRPVLDWLKRRRLAAAYRTVAAATIEHCQSEDYLAGSGIWNAIATLLRTETRARQIASWYDPGIRGHQGLVVAARLVPG